MTKQLPPFAQLVVFLGKDLASLQPNPHATSSKGSLSPCVVETQLYGLTVYPSDHRWWMGSFDCLFCFAAMCCFVSFCLLAPRMPSFFLFYSLFYCTSMLEYFCIAKSSRGKPELNILAISLVLSTYLLNAVVFAKSQHYFSNPCTVL